MTAVKALPFAVLTVCTGNVCRSPMAERLFTARFAGLAANGWPGWKPGKGLTITSAGVTALVGDPMPPDAAELTALNGGDPAGHVSRQLQTTDLESADLVLAMSRAHRREIVTLLPVASRFTFTLREFARLIDDYAAQEPAHFRIGAGAVAVLPGVVNAVAMRRGFVPAPENPEDDDVVDPYRRSRETYERSAKQVVTAVDTIFDSLRRLAGVS